LKTTEFRGTSKFPIPQILERNLQKQGKWDGTGKCKEGFGGEPTFRGGKGKFSWEIGCEKEKALKNTN